MDWIAFTASSAADLIRTQREGEPLAERIEKLNHDVALSYHSWFAAVYKDKYEYLNEWDLMRLAFRLDLGLYYLGIVSQPFRDGAEALLMLPFTNRPSRFVFRLMRLYNRRLAAIARRRRALNSLGRMNCGKRSLIPGFTLNRSDVRRLIPLLGQWAWLEVTEGWRSWGANGHAADAPRAGGTSMPTDPASAKL